MPSMPIPSPPVGYGNLLKGSCLIVMRNLHRLLHLAAVCFLLPFLLTTLYKPIPTKNVVVITFTVSVIYLIAITDRNALLNPKPHHPALDVVSDLSFVVVSIGSVMQLKEGDVEARQVTAICKNFGIVALAVTIGGMMYAAQSLARGTHGHNGEPKSAGSWGSRGLKWTFDTVCASAGVSGVAYWVLLCWPSLLTEPHSVLRSGELLRLVVGASVVGLPAGLYLCLLSTLASLHRSCNSCYSAAKDSLGTSLIAPVVNIVDHVDVCHWSTMQSPFQSEAK